MNERYLFRGKWKDNGKWVEGDLMQWNDGTMRICVENGDDEKTATTVIPETVGQCSGVPDKNGTLMYEGDIINGMFDFEMDIKSICTFKNGSFGLLARQHGAEHFHPFTSLCNIKYEVIGNIYDTPNLLKLKHDSLCETKNYKAGDTK